jgi:hypothetical protein
MSETNGSLLVVLLPMTATLLERAAPSEERSATRVENE